MPSFHPGSWCLASGMHIYSRLDLLTVFSLISFHGLTELLYLKSHLALCHRKLLWENGISSSFHMSLIVDSAISKCLHLKCSIFQSQNSWFREPRGRCIMCLFLLTHFLFCLKTLLPMVVALLYLCSYLISKELKEICPLTSKCFNRKSKCLIIGHYLWYKSSLFEINFVMHNIPSWIASYSIGVYFWDTFQYLLIVLL